MSPKRTRRALLAALAGVSVAGCATDGSRESTDTADPTGTSGSGVPTAATTRSSPRSSATATTIASQTATARRPPTPESITTDWALPGRDQGRTHHAAATGPTAPVGELWSLSVGVPLSTPVVAGGTVYVGGTDGVVRAVDGRTGELTWTQSVGSREADWPARPRVRGGRVYVEGADGLVALDATDGTVLWRLDTGGIVGLLVADHGLYCTERADDSFVRRALADGSERWRVSVDGNGPSGTVVAGGEYVFFTHPRTAGPWSLRISDGQRDFEGTERQPTPLPYHSPSPQCYRDGRLYNAAPFSGHVEAMTPPAPPFDTVWDRRWDPVEGGFRLAVDDSSAYLATGGDDGPALRSLSRSDGTEQWRRSVGQPTGWPVVTTDTLLLRTSRRLVCLDPTDGSLLWDRSAAGVGPFVVADDVVFTTAERTLTALRSVPG